MGKTSGSDALSLLTLGKIRLRPITNPHECLGARTGTGGVKRERVGRGRDDRLVAGSYGVPMQFVAEASGRTSRALVRPSPPGCWPHGCSARAPGCKSLVRWQLEVITP
jgi:hypothetical protein